MPAPVSDGSGAGAQGLSAPLRWLCEHISFSFDGADEAIKRLLSSDSRCCFHLVGDLCHAGLRMVDELEGKGVTAFECVPCCPESGCMTI